MYSQGAVAVGNKVENILSRVVKLEEDFDSRPHDVAEQRRRNKLREYATIFPFDFVLSISQRLRRRQRATTVPD